MNYFSKTRVEAFSDGVFAIIVTLLVLELKVPSIVHHESVTELSKALYALLPKLISWIISFLMVCVIWVNHHRLLNQISNITHGIFWLNALLLLWCSFIPFPTALLGDYLSNPVSTFVFGVVMVLMSFTFTLIRWQAQGKPDILQASINRTDFRKVTWQSLIFGPLLYGLGAVLGFVNPWLSIALFTFIPFYFIFFNTATLLAND
ncbi:TMEM175 family protein [Spirosoma gilvum]